MDREAIVRAGLQSSFDFWAAVSFWAPLLLALATLASGIALYQIQIGIPRQAAELNGATERKLSAQSPAAWPSWLLAKKGWTKVKDRGVLPTPLDAYYRASPEASSSSGQLEILIRHGDQSVALARTLTLGDKWSWPFGLATDDIEDGSTSVRLVDALRGTNLSQFVKENAAFPIDLVGIGLESSIDGDAEDTLRVLSDRRGVKVAHRAHDLLQPIRVEKDISYRSLGLGRNLDSGVAEGTEVERRQRSVLVAVFARLSNDVVAASIEDAILWIVIDTSNLVSGVDLRRYEYAYAAKQRLSSPLTWSGDGTPRTFPTVTVQEALALRPKP